ncbi:Pre-rRNA-processing protein TSR2-domain-containing protein [Blastocladiella britannica]|nr:Pre-rRNA-processing protein TSR2-domain-containing protein [Blastocladiella britannica]
MSSRPQQLRPNTEAALQLHGGVALLLTNWFALRTAVEQGWGGHESEAKATWLVDTIAAYLVEDGHKIDESDLADVLEDIMGHEFQLVLEDGSCYDMAKTLHALFRECVAGDFTGVAALRARFPNTQLPRTVAGVVDSDGDDDDEGGQFADADAIVDGDEEDAVMAAALAAAAANAGSDAMDVDDAPQQPRGPVPDEDGFFTVGRKKRR